MSRIVLVFILICLASSGSIFGVFANESWSVQTAIQALGAEASGAVSGDPTIIATETIKETAESFPESPGVNAAKKISPHQMPSHSNILEVLKIYLGYVSIFFLVSTFLIFFIGGYIFKGVQSSSSSLKRFVQKLTIALGILAIVSLILYFCLSLIFV